jgi:hypothetical protein
MEVCVLFLFGGPAFGPIMECLKTNYTLGAIILTTYMCTIVMFLYNNMTIIIEETFVSVRMNAKSNKNKSLIDHFMNKLKKNKQNIEYTVKEPVQIPMELQNPMVIYDKNTFYPEPSFFLRKNKDFITYPLQQNYTEFGLPTYTYPYKTLNPIFDDPNQQGIIESFENENRSKTGKFLLLLIIVLIFVFMFFMKK